MPNYFAHVGATPLITTATYADSSRPLEERWLALFTLMTNLLIIKFWERKATYPRHRNSWKRRETRVGVPLREELEAAMGRLESVSWYVPVKVVSLIR